jgi:DNA invertase Pin-like site-specific DNA recombinase
MIVGYARTSTIDQTAGLDAQHRDLTAAGCDRIFSEQVSSVDKDNRTKLADAFDFIREGDTLVVTKLDRLAREVSHMMEIKDRVASKGAHLRILDLNMDTSTPTGQLLLTMMGGIAEFERAIMLERQREGIAKAKAEGKGATEIAKVLGIGRASVYRIMQEADA